MFLKEEITKRVRTLPESMGKRKKVLHPLDQSLLLKWGSQAAPVLKSGAERQMLGML